MESTISDTIVIEISRLFEPLKDINDSNYLAILIKKIGWDPKETIEISSILNTFSDDVETLSSLTDVEGILLQIYSLVVSLSGIHAEIENNINKDTSNSNDLINFELISTRLFDYLVCEYLRKYHPVIYATLNILDIIKVLSIRQNIWVEKLHWETITEYLLKPLEKTEALLRKWSSNLTGIDFINCIDLLIKTLKLPGGIYRQNSIIKEAFNRHPFNNYEIRIPVFHSGKWSENYMETDIVIFPTNSGIAIYPYLTTGIDLNTDLSDTWLLNLKGNADFGSGFGLVITPPANLDIVKNIFTDEDNDTEASLELRINKKSPYNELSLIFGSLSSTYLGYKDFGFNFNLSLKNGEYSISFETFVNELTLVIDGSKGDGFIQKILSGIKVESVSDLVIGISSIEGFYFGGSSELSVVIPIHRKLGPIYVDTVRIGIGVDEKITILLGSSFTAKIGPISASVMDLGLRIPMSFPENNSGNFGPIDFEGLQFKFPTGVGLGINTSGLSGGGVIEYDPDNKRYSGIVALKFGNYSLVGIGIIDTIMPDGSNGFSLMINIGVVFKPSIQIAFGFALAGVGGLLGANRTANSEALREGLRAQTLDSILFPEDPIANAPKIISDMRAVFAPKEGRFIIAPMVKITWAECLITADICILLELFDPLRILLLGQLNVSLPKKPKSGDPQSDILPLVEINLDVFGELDFGKKQLSIDASLYNSRILILTLYGDAALRLRWGSNPMFAMSIGGFHPKFDPPPNFPALRRITIALSDSSDLSLICKTYVALTSNSVQFGCRVDLYAAFAGAELTGYLGFDALFYFSPFSFVVSMEAGVRVAYKGHGLASIDLYLELSGPTPWNAKGIASFSILLWDVEIDFDVTWGSKESASLPGKDPLTPLVNDLSSNSSWSSVIHYIQVNESLKTNEQETNDIFLLPCGLLEIRQKTVPFNIELDKYANAPISDHNLFWVESIVINPESDDDDEDEYAFNDPNSGEEGDKFSYLPEHFAMGQYLNYSRDEKLKNPSFEKKDAVISCDQDVMLLPLPEKQCAQKLIYENILIDKDRVSRKSVGEYTIPWRYGKRSLLRDRLDATIDGVKNRFGQEMKTPLVSVAGEQYIGIFENQDGEIATTSDGVLTSMQEAENSIFTFAENNTSMNEEFLVINAFELEIF